MRDGPLHRLVRCLDALQTLVGRRTAIIGGVARGAWAQPRATLDLDALIEDLPIGEAVAAAPAAGLVADDAEVRLLREAGMTRLRLPDHPRGGVRLDLITADHPYYQRVIERARLVPVFGHPARVARPEDVILLKVLADRTQDRADVEAIILAMGDELDRELLRREARLLELELPLVLRNRTSGGPSD